ncbi:MAG: glycosyltransferase [Planctomycetota bacterium]
MINQVTGLLDRGADVRIVSMQPVEDTVMHASVSEYNLAQRTTHLLGQDSLFGGWQRGMTLRNLAWGAASLRGLRYGYKAMNGWLPAVWSAWRAKCDELRPDVVVAHFGPIGDAACCLRSLGAFRAPLATVVHGLDMSTPLLAGKRLYPRLRRQAELMLPISRRWRDALLDDGYDADRVRVHHVGVDVPPWATADRPPPRGEYGREDEPVRFLSVCRLVEKKGLDYALRALAKAKAGGIGEFRYSIVGDGPERPDLESLRNELNLRGEVEFVGALPREQVTDYLLEHDVFLLPSVTTANGDQEGIPTSLMEAMAYGLVAIATRHSGTPELVEDGVSGRLAEERDIDGLCEVLIEVSRRRGLWSDYRRNGWAKVNQEFNIERLNDRLLTTLTSLATE